MDANLAVYSTIYLSCLLWFLTVGYVPASSRWDAVEGYFLPLAALHVPWFVFFTLGIWHWSGYEASASPFSDGSGGWRRSANICALITSVPLVAIAVWWWYLWESGIQTCGACSCSAVLDSSKVTQNPLGYFTGTTNGPKSLTFQDGRALVCPMQQCNWAPPNGLLIQGYPAMVVDGAILPNTSAPALNGQGLATNRPQDFPNPGIGLKNGSFPGLGITFANNTELCPGATIMDKQGVGLLVCSYCGPYWQEHYGIQLPPHCPFTFAADQSPNSGIPDNSTNIQASQDWMVCGLACPQPAQVRTTESFGERFSSTINMAIATWVQWIAQEMLMDDREDLARAKRRLAR
jgi:hypothetical protein